MRYPTWLKRILLPYEFPDHPLYFDKAAAEAEKARKEAEEAREKAKVMEGFRHVMGDEFVDRLENF